MIAGATDLLLALNLMLTAYLVWRAKDTHYRGEAVLELLKQVDARMGFKR